MEDEKFDSVYLKYKNLVMDTACEVLKDYYLAQDVCQEVFLKLTPERLKLAETPTEMKRYLRTVAYHRAIDYYRKIKKRSEISLYENLDMTFEIDVDEKMDRTSFTTVLFDISGTLVHWCKFKFENNMLTSESEKVSAFSYPQLFKIWRLITIESIESENDPASPVADISIPYSSRPEAFNSTSNVSNVELAKTPTHAKVVATVVSNTRIEVNTLIYNFLPNIYFFRIDLYLLSII